MTMYGGGISCFRRVIWIIVPNVQQYRWRLLEETKYLSLVSQSPVFLLQNALVVSKYPLNSLFSRCCIPLLPISVVKNLRPALVIPSPSVNLKTVMFLSWASCSGFSASSRALCFRISKIWSNVRLIMGFQQFEFIFSVTSMNLHVWLNILGPGGKVREAVIQGGSNMTGTICV